MPAPRAEGANDIALREDDKIILRELYEARVMTVAHIAAIVFAGRKQTAHKRIQRLKAGKFIAERPRLPNEPSILFLAFRGYEFVRKQDSRAELPKIPWAIFSRRVQVSDYSLRHELAVLDVKSAFFAAAAASGRLHIDSFSTWPRLYQFTSSGSNDQADRLRTKSLTKPDGFLRIIDASSLSTHRFFVEVDRSTETLDTLVRKAVSYVDYYKSGRFAKDQGLSPHDYKDLPFRVLMIFQNEERRNNVAERLILHRPPILSQIWLSTFEDVAADPLGTSWVRPLDYRDALRGTEFEPRSTDWESPVYRRNSNRERFVADRITKQPLLGLPAA